MATHLSTESPEDFWEVEALYDLCFAPGREALSSYRLRDGVEPVAALCLVLREGLGPETAGTPAGTGFARASLERGPGGDAPADTAAATPAGPLVAAIRYWPVTVAGRPVLLLGPVAVHPTRQGEGLGALLITASLAEAARQGWSLVMLVGDAPYYRRFGFQRLERVQMPPPTNPARVLGRTLGRGSWRGVHGPVRKWPEGAPARPG